MNKTTALYIVLACTLSIPAYAQMDNNAHSAVKNGIHPVHQDKQALHADSQQIKDLDRKRNEALRSNHPADAQKLQAQIDQLRGQRKETREDMQKKEAEAQHAKREAMEKCEKDPQCAAHHRKEELAHQLQGRQNALRNDEAAAARVQQDKMEIARLQSQINQMK